MYDFNMEVLSIGMTFRSSVELPWVWTAPCLDKWRLPSRYTAVIAQARARVNRNFSHSPSRLLLRCRYRLPPRFSPGHFLYTIRSCSLRRSVPVFIFTTTHLAFFLRPFLPSTLPRSALYTLAFPPISGVHFLGQLTRTREIQ